MISILATHHDRHAATLVTAAFKRSLSQSMVKVINLAGLENADFVVAINPDDDHGSQLIEWLRSAEKKLIIFGLLPENLRCYLNLEKVEWPQPTSWSSSPAAASGAVAQSSAVIRYHAHAGLLGAGAWERPLERFDFMDEWNNMGYGAVRADGSIWSLATPLLGQDSNRLASVSNEAGIISSYVTLHEYPAASVLWVNRAAGLIDSFEWRLIENFISRWRGEELPCLPVISEIPYGYDAVVTMRLDCDEDISSARPLWEAYQGMGVPLSLAIHSKVLESTEQQDFLKEFADAGEAVLCHTATHAPNWGGSYAAAREEALTSRQRILETTGVRVRYAVSPFHHSPPYALAALSDVGYEGCIGGIICNDPDFLLARAGELADLPAGFVGHSQQCMLHGDCMLNDDDPLATYKAAFDQARETKTLFGFLDHPFSPRYQYGWSDEETRVQRHRELIEYIQRSAEAPLFWDEITALDFVQAKSKIQIRATRTGFELFSSVEPADMRETIALEYKGKTIAFAPGAIVN
ncbi:polysaccharide deacetylase family protein [uncultured Pseudomonas sp.]|uniref:polysaccharide deacetylase family protein n=1 Tax=uncultured Pseudomonas sp. TaxID=114707 RepID=UPI0025FDEDF6|nr:polysaccharide deacetylase family protein [uncultured Pseudomonas sp.]